VTIHRKSALTRRVARVLAVTPAVLVLTAAAPALATAPDQWGPEPTVHPLDALLVLVFIPLALIAVISFLVYLPSMIRGEKYHPGLAWRNEPEWFGGPRGGIEAAEESAHATPKALAADDGRGGASAHW
jgi:hypothetical protein